ncbi:MAG: hypothetical protein H0Z35_01600 [Thermoanaerobacteraceae bacterium]|nr:hypothetical protein [Thermoanaerobacteraceae bacterium]
MQRRTRRRRRAIAEIFEDLATELTVDIEVDPVFLELNPDIRNFPNISPAGETPPAGQGQSGGTEEM